MPTDTLYGLAADPFSLAAVSRLFAVKGRAADRAVALVAADIAQVIAQLGGLPPVARKLAMAYWPGPLTLLVTRPPSLASELTGGSDQVGVRVPAHEVTRGLCRACRGLLTATSANISGEPASENPDEALPPASLTKMMTSFLVEQALRSGKLKKEDLVSVSQYAWFCQPQPLSPQALQSSRLTSSPFVVPMR